MIPDFMLRALLAGIGVALVAGPLGCFVVWRRMAYFGDSLAHSALLGVALGLLLGFNLNLGILATCVAVALALVGMQRQRRLTIDTLLVILSHSALSIGLVAISFTRTAGLDLTAYLFGDIFAVGRTDLAWIFGVGALILAILIFTWRPLLSVIVHEELARAEDVPVDRLRLVFMLLVAVTVALAMKVIGVLLVSALLIIPAAAARRFARTPEQMAVAASALGCLSVIGGLFASLKLDTPGGPSIVVAAAVLFVLSLMIGAASRQQA
ncbi:MAG: metal ABC transporter permease [Dongiaceae bacterium]